MATYVPGSQIYAREFEHFTPDYKFLSNVLDIRQDRYDTNYKQLSDLYGRVVYADLSRDDTRQIRDQYSEQLSPKIQQISGMDLSLRQNVDAAKGLFKPFYEDDLIVKDLVYTKEFKNNVQLAQAFKESDDLAQRKKYWDTGMQYLSFQMEDFKSADRDKALKQGLPTYVENVDLMDISMKLLKEAGFEDVEIDIPSPDGAWIIREKNGQQQVPGAYNYLQKTLLEDPRVIDAYRASGYVQSRSFAEKGIQAGQYATVAEGQNAWAKETLSDLAKRNSAANEIIKKQFSEALSAKDNWENYQKSEGIIPGSPEEKSMISALENYQKLGGALQRNEEDLRRLDNTEEGDDLLNKAYNLLMSYNISSDILGAAQAFSMRDYSRTMEANPYKKMEVQHKYDMAKVEQQHINRLKEIDHKAKVDPSTQQGALANLVKALFPGMTGVGSDVTKYESVEDAIARNTEDAAKFANKTLEEQVAFITNIDKLNKTGKSVQGNDVNRMTIKLADGKDFTGSYDQVRNELLRKDESGNLVNQSAISNLYTSSKQTLEKLPEINPSASKSEAYINAINRLEGITSRQSISLDYEKTYNKVLAENFDRVLAITDAKGVKSVTEAIKNGVPSIIKSEGYGVGGSWDEGAEDIKTYRKNPKLLSKQEFIDSYISKVKAGKINGLDSDAYVETRTEYDFSAGMVVRTADGMDYPKKRVTSFNTAAARKEAEELYNEQYAILNTSINEGFNTNSAGGARVTQPFSADAFFRGVPLDNMNASDLFTYRGYQETFSINNLNPSSVDMLKNLVKQYNETSSQQRIILPTGSGAEFSEETDAAAAYIFDQTLGDTKRSMLNPDAAASKAFSYDIVYNPVKNIGDKSYASYTLRIPRSQVEEYASKPDRIGNITTEISTSAIPQYSEITMFIPQENDLNPRAAGNYNFSAVDVQMNLSDDNTYNFNLLSGTAGSFKIFKDNGVYYNTMELLALNPKTGLFETQGIQPPREILGTDGNPIQKNQLDAAAAHARRALAERSTLNIADELRWKKQNGITQ
jgi:hypothetical protein